jgi:hypothetical protein
MSPGIYENISNFDYHNNCVGISRTGILKFRKTPRHYYEYCFNKHKNIKKPSKSLQLGSAVHTAILEPHLFLNEYAIKPEKSPLLKDVGREKYEEGKKKAERFIIENAGKIIITEDEYDHILKIKDAVNKDNSQFIAGKIENSIFWENKETGILCKARPDIWLYSNDVIIDLKTCDDASPWNLSSDMHKYGYNVQFAMIQDGIYELTGRLIKDFILLCVETEEPFLNVTHFIGEESIEKGRTEFLKHLKTYKECLEKNEWPGYIPQIINLPAYAA